MGAEALHSRKLGDQVRQLLARASLEVDHKATELETSLDRWLDLLREYEGQTVYLTARAQSREDASINLIETYEREINGRLTSWLPLDYYTLGSLDESQPDTPMLYLHRPDDRPEVRYFVYAFDLRLPLPAA